MGFTVSSVVSSVRSGLLREWGSASRCLDGAGRSTLSPVGAQGAYQHPRVVGPCEAGSANLSFKRILAWGTPVHADPASSHSLPRCGKLGQIFRTAPLAQGQPSRSAHCASLAGQRNRRSGASGLCWSHTFWNPRVMALPVWRSHSQALDRGPPARGLTTWQCLVALPRHSATDWERAEVAAHLAPMRKSRK